MRHSRLLLALGLSAILAVPSLAGPGCGAHGKNGHGGPGAHHGGKHKLWEELNLTDQQKEQMKTLHEKMQNIRKEQFGKMKEIRDNIREELSKENPDEGTLNKLSADLGDLAELKSKQRVEHLLEIKEVLDADQFAKLTAHHGKGCGGCPKAAGCGRAHKGKGCCPAAKGAAQTN